MNLHDRDLTRAAKKEGIAEGLATGILQGAAQNAIESAKNLLKMKLGSLEQIAQAVGLPQEKVLELQKEMQQ